MLLALLLGCPRPPLCLQTAAESTQDLTWAIHGGHACDQPVKVHRVVVRRDGQPVWAFSSTEGNTLQTLTYGVLPEGFEVGREALPLASGDVVELEVRGAGDEGRAISTAP